MFFHLDAYRLREMYENEVDGIISHTFHFQLMEFNKMTTSLVSLQVLTLEKVDKITLISTLWKLLQWNIWKNSLSDIWIAWL